MNHAIPTENVASVTADEGKAGNDSHAQTKLKPLAHRKASKVGANQ